jgi:hypothetical protein
MLAADKAGNDRAETSPGPFLKVTTFRERTKRSARPLAYLIDVGGNRRTPKERAAVRWLSRYTAEDRQLRLAERASSSTCSTRSASTTRSPR